MSEDEIEKIDTNGTSWSGLLEQVRTGLNTSEALWLLLLLQYNAEGHMDELLTDLLGAQFEKCSRLIGYLPNTVPSIQVEEPPF